MSFQGLTHISRYLTVLAAVSQGGNHITEVDDCRSTCTDYSTPLPTVGLFLIKRLLSTTFRLFQVFVMLFFIKDVGCNASTYEHGESDERCPSFGAVGGSQCTRTRPEHRIEHGFGTDSLVFIETYVVELIVVHSFLLHIQRVTTYRELIFSQLFTNDFGG